jgi:hypothetical protein
LKFLLIIQKQIDLFIQDFADLIVDYGNYQIHGLGNYEKAILKDQTIYDQFFPSVALIALHIERSQENIDYFVNLTGSGLTTAQSLNAQAPYNTSASGILGGLNPVSYLNQYTKNLGFINGWLISNTNPWFYTRTRIRNISTWYNYLTLMYPHTQERLDLSKSPLEETEKYLSFPGACMAYRHTNVPELYRRALQPRYKKYNQISNYFLEKSIYNIGTPTQDSYTKKFVTGLLAKPTNTKKVPPMILEAWLDMSPALNYDCKFDDIATDTYIANVRKEDVLNKKTEVFDRLIRDFPGVEQGLGANLAALTAYQHNFSNGNCSYNANKVNQSIVSLESTNTRDFDAITSAIGTGDITLFDEDTTLTSYHSNNFRFTTDPAVSYPYPAPTERVITFPASIREKTVVPLPLYTEFLARTGYGTVKLLHTSPEKQIETCRGLGDRVTDLFTGEPLATGSNYYRRGIKVLPGDETSYSYSKEDDGVSAPWFTFFSSSVPLDQRWYRYKGYIADTTYDVTTTVEVYELFDDIIWHGRNPIYKYPNSPSPRYAWKEHQELVITSRFVQQRSAESDFDPLTSETITDTVKSYKTNIWFMILDAEIINLRPGPLNLVNPTFLTFTAPGAKVGFRVDQYEGYNDIVFGGVPTGPWAVPPKTVDEIFALGPDPNLANNNYVNAYGVPTVINTYGLDTASTSKMLHSWSGTFVPPGAGGGLVQPTPDYYPPTVLAALFEFTNSKGVPIP